MFENISFLFLFAMALSSWAVLCLQHAVEIQKRAAKDYRVELYTELPKITFEPDVSHKPSVPSSFSDSFEFAKSFWVILILTFGLSKLFQLAERKAKDYIKGRKTMKSDHADDSAVEQKLHPSQQTQVMVEENAAMKEQLSVLQTHCLEMSELLHELRVIKSSSSQESVQSADENLEQTLEHSEESMMVRQGTGFLAESAQPLYGKPKSCPVLSSSTQQIQNIYITNSHIHIGGPVFCSDNNFSKELCKQAAMYSQKQSEFVQVWEKYIAGPKERPMIAGVRCNNMLL
ncbi:uncharacterized protein [Drosophila kikkawai]|uniref:Uncharacterized protein n=1 Tax=Drosophila kikkawai TaxID=30033 RepID=A0A6P4I8T6_DROKI|nr:uncharacterized protein LOC108072513 [Drosophila kikkawai]